MFGDFVPEQKKLKLLNYQNRIILQKNCPIYCIGR